MADRMLIDGLIKFCDEKSKNIKLKAEPQVFIEIKQALEELKELRKGIKEIPIATITIDKEDLQRMVDEKIGEVELDIQKIRAKAIDEFTHQLKENLNQEFPSNYESTRPYFSLENARLIVDDVAEQMKAGGIE